MNDTPETPVAADAAADLGESVFDIYETDTSAEENGRWFDLFGDRADGRVQLRALSSKVSLSAGRRLQTQYRRHMGADGNYPIDIQQIMLCRQLAEGVIMNWSGKAWHKNGVPIVYSPAAALDVVTTMPHMRLKLVNLSADLDAFRHADKEAAVGN